MNYKTTIGLEIHIELNTASKMFCGCLNDAEEKNANVNVCPVCLAHPGVLPVINKEAVRKVIKTGIALNCEIAKDSFFERKNYFYPDLPKGYQISQYQAPLCRNGNLELPGFKKSIRIERIHLEEDTGSLVHQDGADFSLVNFNRSGVALMELVTHPDIETSQEARDFVKELQLILRYLGVSNADMEKGQMRVEVNISLRPENQKEFGTKVEIKNLNSIKSVEKSIEYEINRQAEILDKGEKVIQETRGFHDAKQITFSQRSKEEAHDYRYFPEPDLPPIKITQEFLDGIKKELVELPGEKRKRFNIEYGLSASEIEVFIGNKDLAEYFEEVCSELRQWVADEKGKEVKEIEFKKLTKITSNYLSSDLLGLIGDLEIKQAVKASPENFAEFVKMIYLGQVSSKIAKMVLEELVKTGKDPSSIIEEKGWQMVSDEGEIEKAVLEVIEANPKSVEDYKKGKQASLQFLIGQVMAKTRGKANPETVSQILKKNLS